MVMPWPHRSGLLLDPRPAPGLRYSVARVRGVSGKIWRNQPSASRCSSAIFLGFELLGDVCLSGLGHAQTRCPDDCSAEWLGRHVSDAGLNQVSSQSVCELPDSFDKRPCLWREREIKTIHRARRVAV